jgi:elongation factor P
LTFGIDFSTGEAMASVYPTNEFRKNLKLDIDNTPFQIVEFQHVSPGKGSAFTRTKLKNLLNGNVIERTFKSGEKIPAANVEIKDNMQVQVLFYNEKPITVDLPTFVELKVVKTDPSFRGDTVTGGSKPATLETGAVIQVPFHISEGDILKVDTRDATYVEKANK